MSNSQTPDFLASPATRRQLLTMAAVGGAGVAAVAAAGPASAAAAPPRPGTNGEVVRLTVLGTTDLHGNVLNWDYFKNAEYTDGKSNDIGVAKASSIIKAVKAEVGAERTLTIDAGDTIQGTPLAYYYAKIDPITGGSTHPMAAAMNQVGYDAAALGNHEYNYGLDTLRAFEKQLSFPLLSANSVDWNTGAPVFKPWIIKTIKLPDTKAIKVGILGLVTPGVAIWDKANVEGKVKFPGIVEQAKVMVPRLKAAGADVVIVACHSGDSGKSSWGDALPYVENASAILAEEVPGIDAVLVGHAHLEIPQRHVTNTQTGKQVLLSEPLYWGMRVTRMSLDVQKVRGQWQVVHSEATLYNSNAAPEDPAVTGAVAAAHQKVLTYVNGVIGTCTQAMSAATSRYEDTAAIDFINYVQADAVKKALAGTPEGALPVLSIAAPFNKLAAIPAGEVTIRDVAGLYIFDNTLLGIVLTGAQVKAYLEKSAEYFKPWHDNGPRRRRRDHERQRDARLQLRRHGRPRRRPHLRHRPCQAGRLTHCRPLVCRHRGGSGRALRRGDQQLPSVRRGQLPRRRHGSGGLQPPDRDPSADHRLGDGQQGHRPRDVLQPRLEARQQRRPGDDQRLTCRSDSCDEGWHPTTVGCHPSSLRSRADEHLVTPGGQGVALVLAQLDGLAVEGVRPRPRLRACTERHRLLVG